MKTYNHAFRIAFSVSGSTSTDGSDITPVQFKSALENRIAELSKNSDEWIEAVGEPWDSYEEVPKLLEFTVIGFSEDNGGIFCEHVEAHDDLSAFQVAAKGNEHITFVAVVPGHQNQGVGINFPGPGIVDADTVLEQPEVFGNEECTP